MKTSGEWSPGSLQDSSQTRLVIVGFVPLDQSSHWLSELESFLTEGRGLGLSVKILVPRTTSERFAVPLSADPILESLPAIEVNAENFVAQLVTLADAAATLEYLWAWLDAESLGRPDLIYFPQGHPILIRGIGAWLEKQPAERRPSVFFRIIGDELTDLDTGRFKARASFYRLASADLRARSGQERVFFLVNSRSKARAVSRVLRRRPFMMQHHFGRPIVDASAADPLHPVVYVHLNRRSGRLASNLGDIIRRVGAVQPNIRFLIRTPGEFLEKLRGSFSPDVAARAEILSSDLGNAEYLTALSRCTMALLAYESQPYKVLTSGVFTEAASLGKPVVVPGGTWMAEKIVEGYGVGTVFDDHTAQSVAAALLEALQNSDQLGAAARAIAPRLGEETGCRRFIEKMIGLTREAFDTEPRYQIGDEIDFSDPLDSRGFMGAGWGETESWGVWTIGDRAELTLRLETGPGKTAVVLNAFAFAFPGNNSRRVCVKVLVAGRQVAEWVFEADGSQARSRWLKAPLPSCESGSVVNVSFVIDAPASPFAAGLSDDRRMLGLGLCRLSVSPVALP